MIITKRIALTLFGLALACAPATAQDITSVSSAQVDDLEVVNASDLAKFQAKSLGEDIQSATNITDPVSFNYVGFVYTGGSQPFEVEGLVLDVGDDLRVERYELFEMEPMVSRPGDQGMSALDQALWLADQDRADPDEYRFVEVRKGRILIVSGEGAKDVATLNAIRPLAWRQRGSDWPVSLLAVQEGDDEMAFRFDEQAAKHPVASRALSLFDQATLDEFRSLGGTVTESSNGFRVEAESIDLVAEKRTDADGVTTLTLSETIDGEAALVGALDALSAENPGAPVAELGVEVAADGAAATLGGLFGD